MSEVSKNEQLKFTISVNNKKWLFYHQKLLFNLIFKKFQFSLILEQKSQFLPVFFPNNVMRRLSLRCLHGDNT
jgi:hypothetical protein